MNLPATTPDEKSPPQPEAERLLNEAIIAVAALSDHLREMPDMPHWYRANRALHALWEIQG